MLPAHSCLVDMLSFHVVRPAHPVRPTHNGSMHVPYDTEKFYYGFPVYILAYPDEEVGVGITTGSSSYSLGQMVMIGCDSTTHAARLPTTSPRWCPITSLK